MDHSTMQHGKGLTAQAVSATVHCLTGCAIGEVLGMVLATALDLSNTVSVVLSAGLAFVFGYGLTLGPVLRSGLSLRRAVPVAVASDTVSIGVMEVIDNAFILAVPGAIAAGLDDVLFWWSLVASLAVAFVVTVPVNRWLIAKGKGHAVMAGMHAGH